MSEKIRRQDSACGIWLEFRDDEHMREWQAEHRELTGCPGPDGDDS